MVKCVVAYSICALSDIIEPDIGYGGIVESTFMFLKFKAAMSKATKPLQLIVNSAKGELEPCLMQSFCRESNSTGIEKSYSYSKKDFDKSFWNRTVPMETVLRMRCPVAFQFGGENDTYDLKCNSSKQWEPPSLMPICQSNLTILLDSCKLLF